MNKFLLTVVLILLPSLIYSQANCNNPVHLTLCPTTNLTNQTNAGMIDDSPAPCNIAGEDLVYEIYAPNNALHIFVSVTAATGPFKMTMKTGSCLANTCYTYNANSGNTNFTFYVQPSHYYYLWIDAATTITYNISIGGDTTSQYVYTPNTQGNLNFEYCAPHPFVSTKPFYEVEYNGAYKTQPLTLSPLNVSGLMCITFYLRNPTGVSGPKILNFTFGSGLTNVTAVNNIVPGSYNAGNWIQGTQTLTSIPYTFNDSAGIGRGDFTGTPNSCLRYQFCFNVTPTSNLPALTNVHVDITSDTYGMGFSGYIRSGCCSSGYPNCLSSGGPTGGAATIGFGFDDPGGSLPVSLIDFNAKLLHDIVNLQWSTASEINCDYFTIEKSNTGDDWTEISKIRGAGNSTVTNYYSAIDEQPYTGASFYRLKQTDFDGTTAVCKTEEINYNDDKINIYPNPADKYLNIEGIHSAVKLFNSYGLEVYSGDIASTINVENLPAGIYLLQLMENGKMIRERVIVAH